MPWTPEQKSEWWKNATPEEREKIRERNRKNYHNESPEQRLKRLQRRQKWVDENREEIRRKTRERKSNHKKYLIEMLGSKCVGCGVTTNLQFDHIDRKEKNDNVTSLLLGKLETAISEAKKCQLLCKDCHKLKTTINHDCNQLMDDYKVSQVERDGDDYVVRLTRYKS